MVLDIDPSLPAPDQPVPAEFDLLCEHCGYSLVGLISADRCPECGERFDPTLLPLARIPWLYRKRLGTSKAYWRTLGQILFSPVRFTQELCRPVRISAEDARLFRRRTIRIVLLWTLAVAAVVVIAVIRHETRSYTPPDPVAYYTAIAARLVAIGLGFALGCWIILLLGTDLPTFIWKGFDSDPDKLAPVHHYAAAPLILLPFLESVGAATGLWLYQSSQGRDADLIAWVVGALLCVQIITICSTAAVMMRAATGCSRRRQWVLLAYLPVHWAMMVFVGLAGFGGIVALGNGLLELLNIRIH